MFEKVEAATGAYFSGRCVAYTTDASGLASVRNKEAKNPAEHIILSELISKEPLGPMVRRGDEEVGGQDLDDGLGVGLAEVALRDRLEGDRAPRAR